MYEYKRHASVSPPVAEALPWVKPLPVDFAFIGTCPTSTYNSTTPKATEYFATTYLPPGGPPWSGRGLLDFNALFGEWPSALPPGPGQLAPEPAKAATALLKGGQAWLHGRSGLLLVAQGEEDCGEQVGYGRCWFRGCKGQGNKVLVTQGGGSRHGSNISTTRANSTHCRWGMGGGGVMVVGVWVVCGGIGGMGVWGHL